MRNILLLLLISLTTFSAHGQPIAGQWFGALRIPGNQQLRLVFNISKTDNSYSATMDSPDQGAKGIPATSTTFENPKLTITLKNLSIDYTGELKGDSIVGTFKQGGFSLPLTLSKKEIEKKAAIRPQEPAKPYPYHSEDVTFENPTANITLAGTLTLPKKEGNFPAVVLITGSGPQNRNEELLDHKPFLVLADYLTRNGIAVLRYDDRGVADSKGNFQMATSADFATDVLAAVTFLKGRKEINPKHIGLIGHSEGGLIAPMVAQQSKDVGFLVLLAGTGIPGDQLLLKQQELIGKASGVSDSALQKILADNKVAYNIITQSTNTDSLKRTLTNYLKKVMPDTSAGSDEHIKAQVAQLASPWLQYFMRYDPAVTLTKVKIPVLALNGANDLQVPAELNLTAIRNALAKAGNKHVTTKVLPGLNHLFQESKTGLPAEYGSIEQTFSPVALAEIANWIQQQTK
ncbi:alpha/beta hydrolase [Spirosoma sp. BT702]|uniref:Alpha/beta hydrolase n=1 Tax=Spirosoma profusum TaxID=2771354 RepID=A0A926XWZ1_9BACT|nr:alpha/beta hydrolase [Spirosoma profusum]MBD2701665.1 alpha/beta hydrolase [Spirosoma profusum]